MAAKRKPKQNVLGHRLAEDLVLEVIERPERNAAVERLERLERGQWKSCGGPNGTAGTEAADVG